MATPKLLRLKNGTKTKIQIYFLIFIVGPSLAPRSHFSKDILRGKRMHGMGNGTVVLKHNANLKVYTVSTNLITFWSLHLYLSMFDTTKITFLYTTDPNNSFSNWVQRWIPTPSNEPTPPKHLAWKKRRSNNSISCNASSSKKIAGELPGSFSKKSSCYENLS